MHLPAKKFTSFIKRHRNIELLYLFGSQAKRPGKKGRDIDIAVLLHSVPKGIAELDVRTELESDLRTFLNGPVDLVILNRAPVALRQQVLKYGSLLFERRQGMHKDFFLRTVTEYFDYVQMLKFFTARLSSPRNRKAA